MDPQQITQLKQFVTACQASPELVHAPPLAFFKDYLLSLGATLPDLPKPKEEPPKTEEKEEPQEAPAPPPQEPEDEEDLDTPEPEVEKEPFAVAGDANLAEEDVSGQAMGDPEKDVSEDDEGKADAALSKGKQALGSGDMAGAVEAFAESITLDARKTR